jgi:hypothetical protein
MATFRYGGKLIHLQKNDMLAGVKMRKGSSLQRSRGLETAQSRSLGIPQSQTRLGGFELIPLPQSQRQAERSRSLEDKSQVDPLDELRQDEDVLIGTHVYQTEGSPEVPIVPTGELYVVFRPWASREEQQTVLASQGLHIIQKRGKSSYIVRLSASSPNPIRCAVALQEEPLVAIAEPDLAMPLEFSITLPDDPLFNVSFG